MLAKCVRAEQSDLSRAVVLQDQRRVAPPDNRNLLILWRGTRRRYRSARNHWRGLLNVYAKP